MTNKQNPKGFILLRAYPHCNKKVGSFVPFTTGEFLSYPEIWKPVYDTCSVRTERHLIEVVVREVVEPFIP